MTDKDIADKVYIEPLTIPTVRRVLEVEKPDSILPTLGGQTGLNLAMELEEKGILKELGVRLIGINADAIKKAEDRQAFKDTMLSIGEPCVASKVVETVEDALEFSASIGYPVIVRPAYTLGGTGGGIADDEEELREIAHNGIRLSRVGQVLIERCIAGWKEIEYEVMRDSKGNCITVCNMETSTRWVYIRAIRSSLRPASRSQIRITRCCAPLRSTLFPPWASRAGATCSTH